MAEKPTPHSDDSFMKGEYALQDLSAPPWRWVRKSVARPRSAAPSESPT